MLRRSKLGKLDFDFCLDSENETIPIPESFYTHIKKKQLHNPYVLKSDNLLILYNKLL